MNYGISCLPMNSQNSIVILKYSSDFLNRIMGILNIIEESYINHPKTNIKTPTINTNNYLTTLFISSQKKDKQIQHI